MRHDTGRRHGTAALGSALLAAALSACGGGTESAAAAAAAQPAAQAAAETRTMTALGSRTAPAAATPQPASTEGRLLASNCFQCHGTMGSGGFENVRGSEASEVLEYLTQNASRDIMAAHAQGYTRAQLQKVIAYLQQ